MKNRAPSRMRLGKRRALHAIFSAFKWLVDNKSWDYRIQWLDDYPLLVTNSRGDAFLNYQFLSSHTNEAHERSLTIRPFGYPLLTHTEGPVERLVDKGRFVSFTYLDTPFRSRDLRRQILQRQQETIRTLFKKSYNLESPLVVRGDTIQSNGNNSIKECITSLICAKFFMANSYMILEDTGSGPDLVAFKTSLLKELRERRFIGREASVSQLATIRAFGKVADNYREDCSIEEIIAVESESINPQSGINQLRGEFGSQRYSYMGFFDRRVLAAPFFDHQLKGLDVLTYDGNGIRHLKCDKPSETSDFWRSKKLDFIRGLDDLMKRILLLNLTFDEVNSIISSKPLTIHQVIQEIPKLETERILDKIESTISA